MGIFENISFQNITQNTNLSKIFEKKSVIFENITDDPTFKKISEYITWTNAGYLVLAIIGLIIGYWILKHLLFCLWDCFGCILRKLCDCIYSIFKCFFDCLCCCCRNGSGRGWVDRHSNYSSRSLARAAAFKAGGGRKPVHHGPHRPGGSRHFHVFGHKFLNEGSRFINHHYNY